MKTYSDWDPEEGRLEAMKALPPETGFAHYHPKYSQAGKKTFLHFYRKFLKARNLIKFKKRKEGEGSFYFTE
jgi:hypothetical protein